MIKLQTGISTDRDFIKAMKERGQNVSATFPAETLRDQLNELNEDILVSFDSTNETVLRAVNEEAPEPTPDNITITVDVTGTEQGDVVSATCGDEVITQFPATITRVKDTQETLTITCEGYQTIEEDLVFDEDATKTYELAKIEYGVSNVEFYDATEQSLLAVNVYKGEDLVYSNVEEFSVEGPLGDTDDYVAKAEGFNDEPFVVTFGDSISVMLTPIEQSDGEPEE